MKGYLFIYFVTFLVIYCIRLVDKNDIIIIITILCSLSRILCVTGIENDPNQSNIYKFQYIDNEKANDDVVKDNDDADSIGIYSR